MRENIYTCVCSCACTHLRYSCYISPLFHCHVNLLSVLYCRPKRRPNCFTRQPIRKQEKKSAAGLIQVVTRVKPAASDFISRLWMCRDIRIHASSLFFVLIESTMQLIRRTRDWLIQSLHHNYTIKGKVHIVQKPPPHYRTVTCQWL